MAGGPGRQGVLFLPWQVGWPAVGLSWTEASQEAGVAEAGGRDGGCWSWGLWF